MTSMVPRESPWRRLSVWDQLNQVCRRTPDSAFLISRDDEGNIERWSYAQTRTTAETLAYNLFREGVRRGDRVALLMTNVPEWVAVFLACQRIGATVVPLSTWFKGEELRYCLRHSRARYLVTLDRFRGIDFVSRIATLCEGWSPDDDNDVLVPEIPDLRRIIVHRHRSGHAGASTTLSHLLASTEGQPTPEYERLVTRVDASDLALIMYTSGSSGFPKGAMLEQWGIVTASRLLAERLAFGQTDRWFSVFPFFHVGGSIIGLGTALACGGSLVFLEAHDAEAETQVIESERCTFYAGVPAIVLDQLAVLQRDDRFLHVPTMMVNGLPDDLTEITRRFGVRSYIKQYGLTEAYGRVISTVPTDPPSADASNCGRPLDGIELMIVDPDTGRPCPPGETGELWLRGLVMRGYFGEEEAAINDEGWLSTQDLARVNSDGTVTYVGRIKAMLKVGGENVAAEEVEECIRRVAGVLECCVVPVPDQRKGQLPVAYVVRSASSDVSSELIKQWCEQQLAVFKVPHAVEFIDAMPRLPNEKIDRVMLAQRARSLTLS